MEFRVLGPLVVVAGNAEVPLRSAKQRILLAMLLRHANTPVSPQRLIEALWEVPPASAQENVRLYVYQLKRALDLGDRLTREPAGYELTIHAGELDANRFDQLAEDGERALADGDPAKAADLLAEALGKWRGPAYPDLPGQFAARFDEARLRAVETRVAAELALGRHAEVIGELAELAEAHPYREPLHAKLMTALYGANRQAEALEVFRRARERLVDDLGIEPGPDLRGLHETMLRGEQVDEPAPPKLSRADCPYRGLMAYQPEHHPWFFGRDHLVELVTRRIERYPVVGVFGASGSGKSSLLRAGVVGGLDETWRPVVITPTARPVEALTTALASITGKRADLGSDPAAFDVDVRNALSGGPDDVRVLLVVDQLEELFTLCASESERSQFIAVLLDAAQGPHRRTRVVLGIRADFLAHVTQHPGLVTALADEATVLVGPPSTADLRDIVLRPAAMSGLSVAADLLATVLADVDTEPGALPLLSHALVETWQRCGAELNLAAYRAGGGVHGAIAQTAERAYDELGEAEQQAMRRILVRLTAFGDGTEDTRRPIRRAELDGIAAPRVIDGVLDRLVTERLIVLDDDTVEIAHEALIRAWPRLQRWLSDDRSTLLVHRRLTAAAHTWTELDQDDGALYRGTQLVTASAWAQDHPGELNAAEEAFLQASRDRDEAEQVTVKRRNRLLTKLVAIMGVLLVLAAGGGGVAWWQSREAQLRQRIDQSHQLALSARGLVDTAPDLAGQLAISAFRLHADDDTRGALLSTASAPRRRVDLNNDGPPVLDVSVSYKGDVIATADRDGNVTLWDPRTRERTLLLSDHNGLTEGGYARQVEFSADDRYIASNATMPTLAGSPGDVVVWDLSTRQVVFSKRFDVLTTGLAFHPAGTSFAVGVAGGDVQVWDVVSKVSRTLKGHAHEVNSLAFSPDGALLVTANGKDHPLVWDVAAGTRIGEIPSLEVNNVSFDGPAKITTATLRNGVNFWDVTGKLLSELPKQGPYAWEASAPVGGRMAVADEDGLITIWDIRTGRPITTYRDRGRTESRSLALGRDGTLLVSGGFGRTVAVREDAVPAFTGHADGVNDIDVFEDTVASAGDDGTVRLWRLDGTALATLDGHPDRVESVSFSLDGSRLTALTRNHTITIWDVARRSQLSSFSYSGLGASTDIAYQPDGRGLVTASLGRFRWSLPGLVQGTFSGGPYIASAVEFTPDGRLLISTDPAGGAMLWNVAADKLERRVSTGQGDVRDVAISPDGTRFATAGANRTVKVWDVATGAELMTLSGHSAPVVTLAFSPSGHALASGGEDHAVVVWDLGTHTGATLTGHTGPVQAVAFTREDELVSGANDSRIIRWSLSTSDAEKRICAETYPRSEVCGTTRPDS
ncbi:BTAD domain-containing putative transcriptional regulator [Lentzea sp. BCCO 10_0856]|uniref:BTAD domain-containing putative transcriptional regulator n=1 Tax=Lentzea miocenica TaxID=3095431 RepID=A0ABU4ST88_9PSEU|nr:BTAD domain-containing putative transcriptional regulator [Lentzea sp. BCCO 10_0856]MDX8029122.1 BTAD domain-containing putative transcriptional regulator [Lentzea sp. BCCO 10_0856]